MTKGKVLVLILLVFITVSGILLWWIPSIRRVSADVLPGVQNIDLEHFATMEPLEALEWLEGIKNPTNAKEEGELMAFSKRLDTIGYLANIHLAEMNLKLEKDPVPYYQQALALYDTKELRGKLGKELMIQGKIVEAREYYISLLPEDAALESLLNTGLSFQEVGEILMEKKLWNPLLHFIQTYKEHSKSNDGAVLIKKQQARALAELGQYPEALAIFEEILAEEKMDTGLQWWYGRSLEGVGKEELARNIYQSIGESGAYRLGLIFEKSGDLWKAAEVLSSSNQRNSLWRGARLYDELGDWEKAIAIYQELAKETGTYQGDAAYRAYLLLNRKQLPQAETMVSHIQTQPAWMNRLGKEMVWEVSKVDYEVPSFLNTVEAFKKSGRKDLAAIELAIGENTANLDGKLALGDWYLDQNQYGEAVKWGIRALREKPTERAYQLAYQKPYEELVLQAAREYDLDPYLIWAVMREESHYRAEAVSWVGALGLMQIMPTTGKDIAGRLKVSDYNLLNPETNIRFGAYYLRRMLDTFSGDHDKALAAYNGGAGNVRKWSNSKVGNLPEDFPTAITFLETQQYITKVMNSYLTYRWLYVED